MNKKVTATLLILAILMALFFTLQEPTQSRDLSEAVRMWLQSVGIKVGYKELRSNIHILEYFIVGLTGIGFVRAVGLRIWLGVIACCGIGVLDESLKLILPGREFSSTDLIKDFVGVAIAVVVTTVVLKIKHSCETENG